MADPVWVDGSTPLNSVNMTKLQTRDEKGAANGYAPLDATGKVPAAQLPAAASGIPTGAALDFFGTVAPTGFLLCDGTAVSRATYAALFAVIGTTYGPGDGGTTFNLPDTRGRVLVGQGTHADVTAVGLSDGVAVGSRRPKHAHSSSLSGTLPDHSHGISDPGHVHYANTSGGVGFWAVTSTGNGQNVADTGRTLTQNTATGISVTGITSAPGIGIGGTIGAAGMTDSEAYLVVLKIIKT